MAALTSNETEELVKLVLRTLDCDAEIVKLKGDEGDEK